MIRQNKKSQAEVLVSVLLILIVLAAIGIVSTFVINLVKNNLTGTECFKTAGQLKINSNEQFTYYYQDALGNNNVLISIERGNEDFNITGILVSVGSASSSKAFKIIQGETYNTESQTISEYGDLIAEPISLPNPGEKNTFNISGTDVPSGVNNVKIAAIITKGKQCDISDELQIKQKV